MGLFDFFKKKKMFLYSDKEMELYEEYIEQQFGPIDKVFHELVSPDIHLDVLVIPPTEKNNYYKLITMGMGAYKMNVPEEFKEYNLERAELVLYLPPTWDINSSKDEDYWPISQLKFLGRLPIKYNTWLGYGHTVSSGAENAPYADNTKLCSVMLLNAVNNDFKGLDFSMKTTGKINFYQMFPLYEEELNFKFENGSDALLDLFSDEDIMPIVNVDRKNYCKDK